MSKISLRTLLLITTLCTVPVFARADPADEARRQAQMQSSRDSAAAIDRRNADQAFQQSLARSSSLPANSGSNSNSGGSSGGGTSPLPGGRANDSAYRGPTAEGYNAATGQITVNVSGGGGVAAARAAVAGLTAPTLSQTAQRLAREAAAGNAQSQYQLGRMYAAGYGVTENVTEARRLFVAAANQGHIEGSAYAGQFLLRGTGGPVDSVRSLTFLERAASAGNIGAKTVLGEHLIVNAIDTGTFTNTARAIRYLEEAGDAGNATAQDILGSVYARGDAGVPKNGAKAEKYLRMGVEQGNPESMDTLGTLLIFGSLSIPQNQTEGWELVSRSAQAGNGRAMWRLGSALSEGSGGQTKNLAEGLRLTRLSAQTGDINGMFQLSMLTYHGVGLPADKVEGNRLFRLAADAGSGDAQHEMGLTYYHGDVGIAKNLVEAARWAAMSARTGSARGQLLYGKLLWAGEGVSQDRNQAVRFYKLAADQGNETAINDLKDPEVAAILRTLRN
jgi:uncharacterized protein